MFQDANSNPRVRIVVPPANDIISLIDDKAFAAVFASIANNLVYRPRIDPRVAEPKRL